MKSIHELFVEESKQPVYEHIANINDIAEDLDNITQAFAAAVAEYKKRNYFFSAEDYLDNYLFFAECIKSFMNTLGKYASVEYKLLFDTIYTYFGKIPCDVKETYLMLDLVLHIMYSETHSLNFLKDKFVEIEKYGL